MPDPTCLSVGCDRKIPGVRLDGRPRLHGLCRPCYQRLNRERHQRKLTWAELEQTGRCAVAWHPASFESRPHFHKPLRRTP